VRDYCLAVTNCMRGSHIPHGVPCEGFHPSERSCKPETNRCRSEGCILHQPLMLRLLVSLSSTPVPAAASLCMGSMGYMVTRLSTLPVASRGRWGWKFRQLMGPMRWELSSEVCVLTTPLCSPLALQSFTTCMRCDHDGGGLLPRQ